MRPDVSVFATEHFFNGLLDAARRPRASGVLRAILLGALLSWGAAGCSAPGSPFPTIGPLCQEEVVEVLDRRARTVETLYAVVRIAIDSSDLSGTFDVATHYARPGLLRLSAFKELLFSSRPIFDLVFLADRYMVEIHGDEGKEFHRGPLERFPIDLPRFASIYWLREALFLPGQGAVRVIHPGSPGDLGRAEAVEEPERSLEWQFDPLTLEVKRALLRPRGLAQPLVLTYADYRLSGGAIIPGEVGVEDPNGLRMRGFLRDLEVNPQLDSSVFTLEPAADSRQGGR